MKKNTKNRRQNYMCALVVLLTAFNIDEHFHAGIHFTVQSLAFSGHREEKARKKGHFLIKKTSLLMKMAGVFEHTAFFYSYLVVAYIQRQNLVFGGGGIQKRKRLLLPGLDVLIFWSKLISTIMVTFSLIIKPHLTACVAVCLYISGHI